MAADIFFAAFSIWLAFLLRFDGNIPQQYFPFIYRMIFLAAVFVAPVFYFHNLYSFSWAYVSASEAFAVFRATTISFLFLSVAVFISYYFPKFVNFPRSTIFISYILTLFFTASLRLSKRIYLSYFQFGVKSKAQSSSKRALIVGAGDAGEQILRSILSSRDSPYYPVGFVDDNPIKKGISIHGVRVLGKIEDIPAIAQKGKIKNLIIALPSVRGKKIREAVELGKKAGIWKIKIAPPVSEIIQGRVSFKNLKTVEVEDLLSRERVSLDEKEIEKFIKGKKILVTGAAGSIGSELSRQVSKFFPSVLFLLDQDETGIFNISEELKKDFPSIKIISFIADIADKKKIRSIFQEKLPEIVFHAAAYKHVPLMEENPDEAVKNNILGTKILAETAVDCGAEKFIFISTDKAVNPTSVMGKTKRAGEMVCSALNKKRKTKFVSVRFGNVLNSRGSVIPIFREQIKKGGPVEVTHPEMKRYFMLTSEACLLVLQSGAMGEGGEVFVLDMGKPVKIVDLAREMIKLSGFVPDKDIAIVFTGIRPGEKLFEEILTAEEGTAATKNKQIFKARLSEIQSEKLEESMVKLEKAVFEEDKETVVVALKEMIQ